MKKCTFWIAILSLAVSLGTIAVIVMDVWEISVIDSNSFISGLVALFSLAITLLIGYQIYNAVEIRDRMEAVRKDVDTKLNELNIIKNNIEELKNEFKQGGYLLQARLYAGKVREQHYAFLKMLSALRASLDVDNREDGYGWMLDELKEYMLMINNGYPFSGSSDEIPNKIQGYKDYFNEDDKAIRNHDNYYIIRDTYEPLMYDFEKRLNYIAQMKPMSLTEVGECLKTE